MHFEGLPVEVDVLLALDPEELGLRLLPSLAKPSNMQGIPLSLQTFLSFSFAPVHFPGGHVGFNSPYPAERHREIKEAIAEAWAWLEGEGLVVPTLENLTGGGLEFHPRNRRVSRKGQRLAAEPRPALSARVLPKDALHPAIREDVWSFYHHAIYYFAVLAEMKAV